MSKRSRCRLHINKLEGFKNWLAARGWQEHECKGPYEVLRMRLKKGGEWRTLLVFTKGNANEHLTTYGLSYDLMKKWFKERNK